MTSVMLLFLKSLLYRAKLLLEKMARWAGNVHAVFVYVIESILFKALAYSEAAL